MPVYAQLNNDNICIGISSLSNEIDSLGLIKIETYDTNFLYQKYENGQWSGEKFPPQFSNSAITVEQQLKSLKEDNLILMDAIATLFEEILELRGE